MTRQIHQMPSHHHHHHLLALLSLASSRSHADAYSCITAHYLEDDKRPVLVVVFSEHD